ncbi:probable ycaC, hydrolase of unknown specificity [Ramularia collo-cygni]|uniref:Isochorismatase-like domain-containing protein n=1 Tax=Ramularia collo-cygni TaxID=112498 RepID=A0A2D3V6M8_9PEZI|nr:probable ycaC, hydrolase of unknown specificity [Ramularia collo-cygni]CZT17139.1 probable ycaC, hydrolase of unknown specificity [Ramularia collo-cygni]
MRFAIPSLLALTGLLSSVSNADSVPFERLDKNNSLLLILDLQVGLYSLARDFDATLYYNAMLAHSALGSLFEGPNGPLPRAILEMYPNAPLIQRQGEVDAWDNAEFRAAVEATGKKQIIVAGIVTDVCTTFLALSLRSAGYSVWANVEASGTTTPFIRDVSNDRMARAGVQLVSLFSIVCDLMRDWRNTPGSPEVMPWLAKWYPVYGILAQAHGEAILNGTIVPGEDVILGV